MDPNANLAEQLKLAKAILESKARTANAERLAELVLALNEFLSKGGFLPTDWRVGQERRKAVKDLIGDEPEESDESEGC